MGRKIFLVGVMVTPHSMAGNAVLERVVFQPENTFGNNVRQTRASEVGQRRGRAS